MGLLRIFNPGGAGWQTKVTNVETGEEIPNISHIDISIDARGMPMAAVYTFVAPAVDLTINADVKNVCPCCRQVLPGRAIDATPDQPEEDGAQAN